jgi:hypothetical protein
MESLKRRFIYTESPLIPDIYYGKVTGATSFMPTAAYIKANFNTSSGEVGGLWPNPKQYNFNTLNGQYVYFIHKDDPSGSTQGSRAINAVRVPNGTGYSQVSCYGGGPVYKFPQSYPPTNQLPDAAVAFVVYYGKILIDGIWYRVWKSGNYDINPILNVYSIT